MTSSSKIASVI